MRCHVCGYVLDVERRELHRGGEPVRMEPQVFDLLVHLVRHRDRVVSKDDLIATVWGGRIVSDATIDSRVKAVRRAVNDDGAAQRIIRTIPRRGVRFIAEVKEDAIPPAEAYELRPDVTAAASTDLRSRNREALPLPEKPSIAVLSFINLSGDPAEDYFADGLVEDII